MLDVSLRSSTWGKAFIVVALCVFGCLSQVVDANEACDGRTCLNVSNQLYLPMMGLLSPPTIEQFSVTLQETEGDLHTFVVSWQVDGGRVDLHYHDPRKEYDSTLVGLGRDLSMSWEELAPSGTMTVTASSFSNQAYAPFELEVVNSIGTTNSTVDAELPCTHEHYFSAYFERSYIWCPGAVEEFSAEYQQFEHGTIIMIYGYYEQGPLSIVYSNDPDNPQIVEQERNVLDNAALEPITPPDDFFVPTDREFDLLWRRRRDQLGWGIGQQKTYTGAFQSTYSYFCAGYASGGDTYISLPANNQQVLLIDSFIECGRSPRNSYEILNPR